MKLLITALLSFSSAAFAGAEFEITHKDSNSTVVCSIAASYTNVSARILDQRNNVLGDRAVLSNAVVSQLPGFDCVVENSNQEIQTRTRCVRAYSNNWEKLAATCEAVKACENRILDMINQPGVTELTSDFSDGRAHPISKYGVLNQLAQVRGENGCF